MVAIFSDSDIDTANVTLSCADSTGVLTSESCIQVSAGVYSCAKFTLVNNVCTANNNNDTFAISTSCVAPPSKYNNLNFIRVTASGSNLHCELITIHIDANPTAAPTAQPLAGPVATPVKVPLHTPTAHTSDAASLLTGSVVVISSIIALI